MTARVRTLAAGLMGVLVLAAPAAAQGLGIGPRWSFVRGDLPSGEPSTRFLGGTLRLASSKRVVLEVAMDYRTERGDDGLTRTHERPLQGSLLLFPVRSTFSPYLLVGMGLYARTTDVLDIAGNVASSVSTRETGAHAGFGAEIFVARHAALFADYRFRFVRFGTPDVGAEPIDLPGLGGLKLSHRGSMWTSGVAFYF